MKLDDFNPFHAMVGHDMYESEEVVETRVWQVGPINVMRLYAMKSYLSVITFPVYDAYVILEESR